MAAKTRVATIQNQTVRRLELLGMLLLARLVASIRSSLDGLIGECFTDSQIALHWIKGVEKHWKPFVLNRVKEIRVKVPDYCWHHCQGVIRQGGSNPADKPSKGLTMKELQECGEWFTGPSWLGENISRENEFSDVIIMPSECLKELRVKNREVVTLRVVESTGVLDPLWISGELKFFGFVMLKIIALGGVVCIVLGRGQDLKMQREIAQFGFTT